MESDAILLRSFRVMAYCGVLDEEQARRQPFEINAEVTADLRAAGQSDDLDDTINYGILGERSKSWSRTAGSRCSSISRSRSLICCWLMTRRSR